ncbi:purine-nucleoside phosphorylase [Desulfurococcus mucosus]|uniref:Purine or other phosphorylase family 1 n=1 Tax=Desulfurococcus mucosus (strain ATCC 35584 / DSM 2162 / JCM 9187 / O7/1) TaxID=765177 RepID=E8R9I2_DESM0|nr:purine-nucleoside phosphorylase [Desulfurococcus mucosus]ADV65158.1 purine or other phosphorylase family 1 [Desulfurococcus mucosus DSM 2162]
MPVHIKASPGEIAENTIAVGDPGRVDLLSGILEDARVVNTHRGLKTVTGFYKGKRVTIATHGIGAPSASIVFEELYQLGARRIVRVGTTGGIRRDTRIGDVVVATGAMYVQNGCGLGQYIPGLCGASSPDPVLTTRIMEALSKNGLNFKKGPVFSSDAFYAEDPSFAEKMSHYGVVAVEMEAAALFTLGWMRGFDTSCVLVVSDVLHGEEAMKKYLTTEELAEVFLKIGKTIMDVFHDYY